MPFDELNYIAIVSAAISTFIVSGIWYSDLLFAKEWMRENNFTMTDLVNPRPAMIASFISILVLAFGVAVLIRMTGTAGWINGASFGAILAILIHGAAGFPNYAFERRSLKLFLIHLGNSIFGLMVMGAILASW